METGNLRWSEDTEKNGKPMVLETSIIVALVSKIGTQQSYRLNQWSLKLLSLLPWFQRLELNRAIDYIYIKLYGEIIYRDYKCID
jgi:hypothetical protein